jgi:hypothetical protein
MGFLVARLALALALALALLAGCREGDTAAPIGPGVGAGRSGSGALTTSADGAALYAVLADEGLVARADPTDGAVDLLALDDAPSRLTRLGDTLLVTLRGARAIVVLEDDGGALVEVDRVATGAEPLGIVASPDGDRVWVALHGQDEVHELDADLAFVRAFAVAGRPSWLAVHPSGASLYVVSGAGGTITWFDLDEAAPAGVPIDLPPVGGAGREGDLDFTRRLTGDPAVRFDGGELAVPGLWVDNTSPPRHTDEEQAQRDPAEGYARIGLGLSPNNPGVVFVGLDPDTGAPLAGTARFRYATSEATPVAADTRQVVRSFLGAVTYSPDGALVAAAMEGSRLVVVLPADPTVEWAGLGGFTDGPGATLVTEDGPRGLAWGPGGAWVLNAFALSVAALPIDAARAGLDEQAAAGARYDTALVAAPGLVLTPPVLEPTLQQGRLLFSTAVDPHMSTPAAGLSCSTCHFEGREDGLSWPDYDTVGRQTKTLAGPISLSPPFTWTQDVMTVADEVRATSQVRLGGRDATQAELDAVAAWIEHTPEADHAARGAATPAVERGRVLFADPDVGCAACHYGDRYSDQLRHTLYGLADVDTPSLIGIAATLPYLHDGAAPTLRDVLEGARDGSMGDTSALSDADLEDLEAFLRSL